MTTEFTIIGAGLAGTTLAWALVRRGRSVIMYDAEPPVTSSRVAAGLMTPITGKRLAKSWRWDELRPVAERFYHGVEAETGTTIFHPRRIVRLFTDVKERQRYTDHAAEFAGLVEETEPLVNPAVVSNPLGGFVMPTAAQLDVVAYLDASREWFRERGWYQCLLVSLYSGGRGVRGEGVAETPPSLPTPLPPGGRGTIYCLGYGPHPLFASVRFRPAKGEILTVRISGLNETRVLNRGGFWVAPTTITDVYRVGATYSWHNLDCIPTEQGRSELEQKLRELVRLPFVVIGHQAAVRPIAEGQKPRLGLHPMYPHIGYFNGLSSKGSLLAPFFAEQFAAFLCGEGELDAEVDVRNGM
jgi:glycine/D-amino acid oxidase-like deaminating enzyme